MIAAAKEESLGDVLNRAAKRALGGGIAGAAPNPQAMNVRLHRFRIEPGQSFVIWASNSSEQLSGFLTVGFLFFPATETHVMFVESRPGAETRLGVSQNLTVWARHRGCCDGNSGFFAHVDAVRQPASVGAKNASTPIFWRILLLLVATEPPW
jgi:hypothetical protein